MPIEVTCQCGKRLKAKDELAGRAVKCPNCQQPLKIPAPQATAPAAPAAADAFADLFDDAGLTHQAGPTCPSCNAGVAEGAVICIHCGFNLETGQKLRTNIGTADVSTEPAAAGPMGHGAGSGGGEAEAILAKAALTEDPEEDMGDLERYGSMGIAWLVGGLMLLSLCGALYGIYYYNEVYLPANQTEEEVDEYN